MAKVAVVFESKYGQSAKIADHVAGLAMRRGHDIALLRATTAIHDDLGTFDAFVVVAPVYYARHAKAVERFLGDRAERLTSRPWAFVSVSGSAASRDPSERDAAERLARTLLSEKGVKPRLLLCVGGATAYPKYNPLLRWVMKRISARRGGPTDTSRTHEETDWGAIDEAIGRFLGVLDLGAPSPQPTMR